MLLPDYPSVREYVRILGSYNCNNHWCVTPALPAANTHLFVTPKVFPLLSYIPWNQSFFCPV